MLAFNEAQHREREIQVYKLGCCLPPIRRKPRQHLLNHKVASLFLELWVTIGIKERTIIGFSTQKPGILFCNYSLSMYIKKSILALCPIQTGLEYRQASQLLKMRASTTKSNANIFHTLYIFRNIHKCCYIVGIFLSMNSNKIFETESVASCPV